MEKYGQTTDDNMIQHREEAGIDTLIIFHTYCLSRATRLP